MGDERPSEAAMGRRSGVKAVHFLLKPDGSTSGAEGKPAAAGWAAERGRPGDGPCGWWPEPSLQGLGAEQLRTLAAWGRHFRGPRGPGPVGHRDNLDIGSQFAGDARKFSLPYLYLVDNILKSTNQPQIEKIRGQSMTEMIRLSKEIKQAQMRQRPMIEEIRLLYTEKTRVQAENQFFLDHIANKTEESKKQPNKLWTGYMHKVQELERQKQTSSAQYETKIAGLRTELLEKEKVLHKLTQCLEELKTISTVKEKQDNRFLALKEEKEKIPAETNAKIQEIRTPFLQEKALLEELLKEKDIKRFGKSQLFGKTPDLESAAWHHCVQFSRGITRGSLQVQKELLKLIQRCVELEAAQVRLKSQKHQLQQKQWYLEGLVRGREHLQRRHHWRSAQGAPKATQPSTWQPVKNSK